MRLLYTKPELKDLSQGSRIAFVRQFRFLSQDELSDKLGLTGECKRRTMTRYEKGNRHPKKSRLKELSKILNISENSIKEYDYKNSLDICYTLMWLEEIIPKYQIDISKVPNISETSIEDIKLFVKEWDIMRMKRQKRDKRENLEISDEEYLEWKLNYEIENK